MIVGISTGLAGADSDNPGGFNLGSSRLLIAIGDETTELLWKRPASFVELERQFQPQQVYTYCRRVTSTRAGISNNDQADAVCKIG